jgi:hypothetical protein
MQVETRQVVSGSRCQVSGLTRGARQVRRRVVRIALRADAARGALRDVATGAMFEMDTLGNMIGSL